ncbi:unnamed protein product [Ascophyllum nodosum]
MCCIYRKALKTVLFVSVGAGPYLRRWSFVRGVSTSCVVIPYRPPAFVTSMISGTSTREKVQLPSGRFAACWPIGLGTYNGRAAVFLASGRRILNPRDEVLPVPVVEEAVPLLAEAMQPRDVPVGVLLRACAPLFGRDGGMYDNLPWRWSGDEMAKREAFKMSQGSGMMDLGFGRGAGENQQAFGSAYGLLADAAARYCSAEFLSLILEEEESVSGGVSLGGSAYLRRSAPEKKGDGEGGSGERTVIEVTTDEAVGVALSLGRQIYVSEDIWEGARVRPKFVMVGDKMRLDLNIKGEEAFANRDAPPEQPPAWAIKSRGALFRMDPDEKRSSLRASGVRPPRKRALSESTDADKDLEDLMLPLMDEAVRRDVLLARAWRAGDFAKAGELCADKSERHIVAEQLQMAMKDDDQKLASILIERLEVLDSCRMDLTQDVGAYQKDLDADEWYLRDRRRSQGTG